MVALTVLAPGVHCRAQTGEWQAGDPPAHDWQIIPGQRVGPVKAASTYATLRQTLGDAAVVESAIDLGEGFQEPGFLLYPNDPSKTLAVIPPHAGTLLRTTRVIICYQQQRFGKCSWKTAEGVTHGVSLKKLEALNRKPFRLLGFAWDWEGAVISWQGGRLQTLESPTGRVLLNLSPPAQRTSHATAFRQVSGDSEFSSGHPAMQALNPCVYLIRAELRPITQPRTDAIQD